jgi:MOSC domain-containing protein YiiM
MVPLNKDRPFDILWYIDLYGWQEICLLDNRKSEPGDRDMWKGSITHLHLCPQAFLPMQSRNDVVLVAERGIEGDRYLLAAGFYSGRPEVGRQVTLFEIETLEALQRDLGITLLPQEHRRNVTTRGVPLNHLVHKRFKLGEALLEATRLSVPCKHLEEVTGKTVFKALINRSGLNCRIVTGGVVRVGDTVEPA